MRETFLLVFLLISISSLHSQQLFRTTQIRDKDTLVDERIKGIWKSAGGGYLLKTENNKIKLYSYTSKHCYEEKNEYLSKLINEEALFYLNKQEDSLSLFLHDFGSKTTHLQSVKRFYKVKKLPGSNCSITQQEEKDPVFLFDLFWQTLKENYAYSSERNISWEKIYSEYKQRISSSTTQDSLFKLMGEIVTLTRDQHTKINSPDGKSLQYSGVPSAVRLQEVFKQQDSIKDFNTFANQFFQNNYNNISNGLLKGKGQKVANNKIEFGDPTQNIGYIHIHSLTGFASSKLPRKQHIDTLDHYMRQIMRSFQDKKAIIIDVSLNFGGYDAAGLTIASYFTDQSRPVYHIEVMTKDGFVKNNTQYVYPSGKYRFNKPVYVITSDITRSAAETFALQMKSIPNVTLAGTNTLGITSDMLGKTIGDYYLTLSYQKYISPSGEMPEVKGVTPNIQLEIFPKENMFNGHRDTILKVIRIIEQH